MDEEELELEINYENYCDDFDKCYDCKCDCSIYDDEIDELISNCSTCPYSDKFKKEF